MRFKVRLVAALLRVAARLPLPWLHALGTWLGWLARRLGTREARVAARNMALAFPELDAAARAALLDATLAEAGKSVAELPWFWGGRPRRALALVRAVHGLEYLEAAERAGRGVIVAAPHLGAWELLNLWLSARAPLSLLYRVPQRAEFEPLLNAARGALGAEPIRAEAATVRVLFRRLREGRTLGILPDQRPKGGEGAEGTFFGRPAMTMTLLGRLAHRTGATVVFGFARRLPRGAGFELHFLPAELEIADADATRAVAALNRGLEACVRLAPAQYQWTYKRFGFWKPGDPPEQVYAGIR